MPRQPSGEAQTVAQRVQRHRRGQIAELARLRAEVERLEALVAEMRAEREGAILASTSAHIGPFRLPRRG